MFTNFKMGSDQYGFVSPLEVGCSITNSSAICKETTIE